MTQKNLHRAEASPHSPNEIHLATNGHIGEDSPLAGNACRKCSPRKLIQDLDDGELIDTDQVVWWPCHYALQKAPT